MGSSCRKQLFSIFFKESVKVPVVVRSHGNSSRTIDLIIEPSQVHLTTSRNGAQINLQVWYILMCLKQLVGSKDPIQCQKNLVTWHRYIIDVHSKDDVFDLELLKTHQSEEEGGFL